MKQETIRAFCVFLGLLIGLIMAYTVPPYVFYRVAGLILLAIGITEFRNRWPR